MEKSLPANIDAERATLGSILLNRDAIIAIASWLQSSDFYMEQHAWIYEAMLTCYNARVPPDTRTVSDELRRHDRLDKIGGIPYLAALVDSVPTSYHIEYYAQIVQRTALLRKLIGAGGKIAALGYDEHDDVEATLDKAEGVLFEISQRRSTQDFVHIGQVIDSYYEQINYLQEHRGEVAGVPTGYRDLDEITGGLQRSDLIILAARPGVGKCMAAWTLIDDPATGARLTIEEYVKRRLPCVYGVSERGDVRATAVSDWIDSGVQPCYRVRTRTGRMVEVTGHHPFLTVNGWTPLHDLSVGDSIAVPRAVPTFGNDERWPIEMVRLLAYFIAEGGLTSSSPAFTNTDPVIVDDFCTIIAKLYPNCTIRKEAISYYVARPGRGGIPTPNLVYEWLDSLGLKGKLAKDKFFPACVWTWSRHYLAEFIRVLMSCDGSIYPANGKLRIEFTVASQRLASDLHHAFVRFGLIAKLYQTASGAWRVEMTDTESLKRYQEEIGWIGEKSARFLSHEWNVTQRRGNNDHAPQATWNRVCAAARTQGVSLIELARQSGETTRTGKFAGYNPHTQRSIPRYRLAQYARVLNDTDLHRAASPDLYWDAIMSIEPIGAHQVYDLTVPDGANFIAQDVCVHNTSFAMSLGYNIAIKNSGTVGIFSLEMSREQLVQRLLAMETKIDTHKLRTGHIRESELQIVMEAMGQLAATPIYIEDTPGLSIMEVRSKARRLQSRAGVDLIIIDYLQLMQGRRSDNRVQEVSEISRGLKALARELNVPVIALSQLSRAVEGRTSHVPMLSDLRESGSIEQDADIVMFIYREEMYDKETDKKGIAELHIAKHRNGPIGVVSMHFDPNTTRFSDLTYRTPSGY
jgi:replicative DNA helicase